MSPQKPTSPLFRTITVSVVVAAVLAVGVVSLLSRAETGRHSVIASDHQQLIGTATHTQISSRRTASLPLLAAAAGAPAPAATPLEQRVRAALARFEAVTSQITKEQLEAEQEAMKEAYARMLATPQEDATSEAVSDANGQGWIKRTFPSGEVRYDFQE